MAEADDAGRGAGSALPGRLMVLGAAAMWSLSGVLAKGLSLDGPAIAFYRGLFAGLALLPFVPRGAHAFRPGMLVLAVVFAAMTGLYLGSMRSTTAANAIFLQSSSVIWVVPIGFAVLRERVSGRGLAGVGLAAAGIAVILASGRGDRPHETLGIVYGLASGVGFAGVLVGLRRYREINPTWLCASNNLGGALLLGLWVVATGGSIPLPHGGDWATLVVFGVVQMAIPYVLFTRGLRTVPAAEAGLIGLIEPILNPLWVYLQHGERPGTPTVVGGALVLAGVAVGSWPRRTR